MNAAKGGHGPRNSTRRTLTPHDRDVVARAILQARGGYSEVERLERSLTRIRPPSPTPEEEVERLRRELEAAHARIARLKAANSDFRREVRRLSTQLGRRHKRGSWWHEEARRMRASGMSYPAIGRHFGVDHTTVMYACKKAIP